MSRENSKIFPPYYLGLDIGTESIGSAITDPHYQILRIAGKPAMSVRLFETANTGFCGCGNFWVRKSLKWTHLFCTA